MTLLLDINLSPAAKLEIMIPELLDANIDMRHGEMPFQLLTRRFQTVRWHSA